MAIELAPPPQAHKAAASVPANGKKSGQPAAGEPAADDGFSTLMNSLSATDAPSATVTTNAPLEASVDTHDAAVLAEAGLFTPPMPVLALPAEGATVAVQGRAGPGDVAVSTEALRSRKNAAVGVVAQTLEGKVQLQSQTLPQAGEPAPLSFATLMMHRQATQSASIQAQLADVKDQRATPVPIAMTPVADPALTLLASAAGEVQRLQERSGGKSNSGPSGGAGLDAVFGTAATSMSRSDAVFVVPPAAATVADTAVAETVSYWASHGVQTAELTLDGFGESPVEVRILLTGDQAQIDFRTDQSGVRYALQEATEQLKELLSGQGLQLTGVSVGASGRGGGSGENRRAHTGAQRVSLVKEETPSPVAHVATYPSVGRSLDLFV